jgi:hypothetical protein
VSIIALRTKMTAVLPIVTSDPGPLVGVASCQAVEGIASQVAGIYSTTEMCGDEL